MDSVRSSFGHASAVTCLLVAFAGSPRVTTAQLTTSTGIQLSSGAGVGRLVTVSGGTILTPADRTALTPLVQKLTGDSPYARFVATNGLAMPGAYWSWIRGTLQSSTTPPMPDGQLLAVESGGKVLSTQTFRRAIVTNVALPALDVSSKNLGSIRVTFLGTNLSAQSGTSSVTVPGQSQWTTNDFRLSIQNLTAGHVKAVGPITFTLGGSPAVSLFTITVPTADADPYMQWYQQVIQGGTSDLKSGSISYMSADFSSVLMTVSLSGLQIMKLGPSGSTADGIATTTVTMSARALQLQPGSTP